jgi:putative ABC transport system permease protein
VYAMRRDFAYAFRQLVRHPRFAATIILPVAVALGLSTAVATIADALLIKNLPYPDADRLVRIDGVFTRLPLRVTESGLELTARLSAPEISSARSLAAVGMYSVGGLNAGGDHPRRLRAATVTPGFFDALRVSPHLGHVFTERDVAGTSRVVVISARLWHAYFQSEPDVIGRVLHLNGCSFVVMAVMSDEFDFPEDTAVWIPTGSDAQVASQVAVPQFIARLQTGATTAFAQQELLQIVSRDTLTRQDPDRPTLRVQGLQDALVTPIRSALWFVACAALLLLLVVSLNASNLIVARVCDRQREFAVRRAIGATTIGVLRPIACESFLLVMVATGCAVPLAAETLAGIRTLLSTALVPVAALTLTMRSLWILLLLSGIAAIVLGFMPVLAAVSNATVPLQAASTSAPAKRRASRVIVTAQVASALVVLTCAMMIVVTIQRLQSVDLGASHDGAVIAEITLPAVAYGDSTRHRLFFDQLRAQLRANPGVTDVGLTNHLPGTDVITPSIPLRLDRATPASAGTNVLRLAASPGYFSALGIDVVAGRPFTNADDRSSSAVAVVSTACVRAIGLSPDAALGRRINVGLDGTDWATIVGVVRDVRMRGPESETTAALYVPFGQTAVGSRAFVVVNGPAERSILIAGMRAAVSRLDPNLPLYNLREFREIRAEYLATRRFAMTMALAFGLTVFAGACYGLNAIITYMVRSRSREISVRLAIGATPFSVGRSVIQTAAGYAAGGVAVGATLVPLVQKFVMSTIPGVALLDGVAVASLAATILAIATLSACLPATRAARMDPINALRTE